ncbi:MAG: 16S rRNA (cytosine(1402)-N(4))-methyltransferase RsmH [Pseudomonadales bacterium]
MTSPSEPCTPVPVTAAHHPVLLDEAVGALLDAQLNQEVRIWIDGTFGRGGHARAILSRMRAGDRLVVVDRDPAAIEVARELAAQDSRVLVIRGVWTDAVAALARAGIREWHGVLLDLGVSSPQLDAAERGFSFRLDGPLDMRMDPEQSPSAADWLNSADENEIARVLREYGEELKARRIAREIVRRRPLQTTRDLLEAVTQVLGPSRTGRSEATRTFQAVRIQVNDELGLLRAALPLWFGGLASHGRLVVISFHSLEDRIVKRYFRERVVPPALPRRLPVRAAAVPAQARLVGRSRTAGSTETAHNPRARSARLRVLERLL